jgi:hypothetical protein
MFSKDSEENNLFYEDILANEMKFNSNIGDKLRVSGSGTLTKSYIRMPPSILDLFLMIVKLRDFTWLKVYKISDLQIFQS